ncbi:MAG: protein phosphatase 2C domain-containing protein [Polyangiaceae bacterium]|nr:protein phosphatase 2C domain-containing protein [Polyangiaceae bacterium]MCW5790915.1 protein phosphatase 2C domain-containing protein [Polyangiaceae bacterium]
MPSIVPHFDFRVAFGVATDQGKRRETLEDAYLVAPELSLFAVADGMGGHAGGEEAARLALDELRRSLAGDSAQRLIRSYVASPGLEIRRRVFNCLRLAVEQANRRVREEAAQRPELAGMGTTLDVAWLARDRAFLAHAGDSRAYLARDRATLQLTQDHAQIESLKAEGKLHADAKQTSQNRLLNAVGLTDAIQVDTLFVQLARGDRLLLCSDGVHGQIDGEARLGELIRSGSAQAAADALVAEAGVQGRDNATAVVVALADRFVQRAEVDRGLAPSDLEGARSSPLLSGVPLPQVLATLAVAVEIELSSGEAVPQVVTSDRVAYVVLEGLVQCPGGRMVGGGALLFPESLVGVVGREALPVVEQRARLLRLRADDFQEICDADPELSAQLFKNLAQHLARLRVPGASG